MKSLLIVLEVPMNDVMWSLLFFKKKIDFKNAIFVLIGCMCRTSYHDTVRHCTLIIDFHECTFHRVSKYLCSLLLNISRVRQPTLLQLISDNGVEEEQKKQGQGQG